MIQKPSSCSGCQLFSGSHGKTWGYVPSSGEGSNGVLMVLEAAGEDEEASGIPAVGKAGQYLWSQLKRVGIERDGFRVHTVLSCRPPGNTLVKMPYTDAAIAHCAPNLDRTIHEMRELCQRNGKTFVILALGKFAFKRVMRVDDKNVMGVDDRDAMMRADYQSYPHWSERYGAWVLSAPHPSHIMQGKHNLAPTLQFITQRAVEIAAEGLTLDAPTYLLDPDPVDFSRWVDDYIEHLGLNPTSTFLSYDIETPNKQGKDESEVAREDDDDYTILRCSFAYLPGVAVSVPWQSTYMASIERLFGAGGYGIGWNNSCYDDVRILQYMPMSMIRLDGMLAWHVLNTALPKGLGYVTPFYWKNVAMWKHLSEESPAFYNAKDADAALRCFLGIKDDLIKNGLWDVFDRHVVKLNEVLAYMSREGVRLDQDGRAQAEVRLQAILDALEGEMQHVVPQEARKLRVYRKQPKNTEGMVAVNGEVKTKRCSKCGATAVRADHFKSVGKKALKGGAVESGCHGASAEKVVVTASLWAKPLSFKISKLGLSKYQQSCKHQAIIDRREKKVTYDANAMKMLIKRYPDDPLYPLIGKYRGTQKLLGTYVGVTGDDGRVRGGMPVGRDGKVHTLFTHNPSTLRLASQQPNLQNLPRPAGPDDLQTIIRQLIVADDGMVFGARDFGGIEAILVGYEARSARIIRLAKMDIHSYYTAYALNQLDGRVHANDLPQLSWDDEKLSAHLAGIKKEFKWDRNELMKHLVHAIHFGQQSAGAQSKIYSTTGILHPIKKISFVMDVYRELFPEVPKWQQDIRLQADRDGHLKNAFGYIHRFSHVFGHRMVHGGWERIPGDDSEAVLAFKPQSNAAGIMKEALLRLYFNRFEEAGRWLRLTIHDEIFWQCPPELLELVDAVVKEEMERLIPQLPLPASYGMGTHLGILTEGKSGKKWGLMH